MAYIPTIKTFEDDINENRGFDEAPISGGTNKIYNDKDILVPEKESSLTKKILTLFSILLILGSLAVVGYYFYNNYKQKKADELLALQAAERQKENINNQGIVSDLEKIFPKTGAGMASFVGASQLKNNVIILTINPNDAGIDNYSQLYAYLLANERDLGSDLLFTFKVDEIDTNTTVESVSDSTATTTEKDHSPAGVVKDAVTGVASSALNKVSDALGNDFFERGIKEVMNTISRPTPISAENLNWESKTLENQDFKIANAGVLTLIYGYSGKNYAVFTTSLKDFFDTLNSLR